MTKPKNDFTYTVEFEGGVQEGPLTFEELQPLVQERKVTGSTIVKRSDRTEWTTAADLPELNIRDVVEGRDRRRNEATVEKKKEVDLGQIRAGTRWFFLIAAIGLVNSGLAALGIGQGGYGIGLGGAQLASTLGESFGNSAVWHGVGVEIALSVGFLVAGMMARHGRLCLVRPAVGFYIGDAALCMVLEKWVSVGVHGLALYNLVPAIIASYDAGGIELTKRIWARQAAKVAVISILGVGAAVFLDRAQRPKPASWSDADPADWPAISLANDARFIENRVLRTGNAFLIRLKNGRVIAATGRQLLGEAGGVRPPVSLFDLGSNIEQWKLRLRGEGAQSIRVFGAYGFTTNYGGSKDWAALEIVPEDLGKLPTEPLSPRLRPVKNGERVHVVGVGAGGTKQQILSAKVRQANKETIIGEFESPLNLTGFSGSPVVDEYGAVVGILRGGNSIPDAEGRETSFLAESIIPIRKLLE